MEYSPIGAIRQLPASIFLAELALPSEGFSGGSVVSVEVGLWLHGTLHLMKWEETHASLPHLMLSVVSRGLRENAFTLYSFLFLLLTA